MKTAWSPTVWAWKKVLGYGRNRAMWVAVVSLSQANMYLSNGILWKRTGYRLVVLEFEAISEVANVFFNFHKHRWQLRPCAFFQSGTGEASKMWFSGSLILRWNMSDTMLILWLWLEVLLMKTLSRLSQECIWARLSIPTTFYRGHDELVQTLVLREIKLCCLILWEPWCHFLQWFLHCSSWSHYVVLWYDLHIFSNYFIPYVIFLWVSSPHLRAPLLFPQLLLIRCSGHLLSVLNYPVLWYALHFYL